MAYTLEQLRAFVAVAEELHFGRAAERLSMTQPPLSRQIQRLERAVGVRLLERDNRRVCLTHAGGVFLAESRRLLALADAAPEQARRVHAGSVGRLAIGFTAVAAYQALGDTLAVLGRELPGVDLDLAELVTSEQVAALTREELDLGLGRPPHDSDDVESVLLQRESLVVAAPAGHPLLRRRVVRPDEVEREPLIAYSPDRAGYLHDLVTALLPPGRARVAHTVSQVLTMLWLVAAGRGVALVPASATRLGIEGVGFVPLSTPTPEPVELHLLWRSAGANPAVGRAVEVLTPTR